MQLLAELFSEVLAPFDYFMDSEPAWLVFIVLSVLIAPFAVWLHELGHALAATRLLDEEVEITIGSFGKVLEAQIGSLRIRVNALSSPLGASGQASFAGARATARDVLLIALAGPAASACGLAITAVALAWAPPGLLRDALVIATLCGTVGVIGLVPLPLSRARHGRPAERSDGQLALEAARVLWQLR